MKYCLYIKLKSYICRAKQKKQQAKHKQQNKERDKTMRTMHKTPKVNRQRAIEIAANHNCVAKEIAASYTDSELREVLRHLGLKAGF